MTETTDPMAAVEERVAQHLAAKDWLTTEEGWAAATAAFRAAYVADAREVIAIVRESAAVLVVPPADRAALRDRIAEALADADGWSWVEAFDKVRSSVYPSYQKRASAVLGVLPGPAEAPAAECSAQNRNYESGPRQCIRAAQHHGDHIDEHGFHWSDTVAVYPVGDGTFRQGTDVRAELRRVADEAQQSAPRQWCKCPSCWGWFVEDHPGEDLDELGRDLGWWSGLPVHRDAPAEAQPTTKPEPRRCPSCGHLSCDGDGPCGALLSVSALSEQRCPCAEQPAVVSEPGKEA